MFSHAQPSATECDQPNFRTNSSHWLLRVHWLLRDAGRLRYGSSMSLEPRLGHHLIFVVGPMYLTLGAVDQLIPLYAMNSPLPTEEDKSGSFDKRHLVALIDQELDECARGI
jgi:hypothetical protein